jgi:hypothetical protein
MRGCIHRLLSLLSQDGGNCLSSATDRGRIDTFSSTDSMGRIYGTKGHRMRMLSRGRIFVRKAARACGTRSWQFLREGSAVSRDSWSRVRSYFTFEDAMTARKFVSAHDPRVQELKSSLELESRQVLFSSTWFVGGETSAGKMRATATRQRGRSSVQ